jgi:protoheme ferro-lyase
MGIFIGALVIVVSLIIVLIGVFKYKNRRLTPDYFEYYKAQDTVPSGKIGIFVPSLIMPEKHDHTFFYNITMKIFTVIIPWPFRLFAQADRGIALLDPVRFHEDHPFTPTKLEDPFGNDLDIDGTPYIQKYREGKVQWIPPSKNIYLDHGYFLYPGRKGGMPSFSGKVINKARLWYYQRGIVQQKLPHWEESFKIIHAAFGKLQNKHKEIECRAECSLYYHRMREKLFALLDGGCDTIVLGATMAIYSHFEEFNSSFRHCFEYIHEWEKEHPGKKIKVIMAPPMGHFQPLRQAFLDMLRDRLSLIPAGSDVTVAVLVHGMPWDRFQWEAWLQLAPPFRDKLLDDIKELLKSYKLGRTNVVSCQDEFANPVWDPKEKYLSTNRVFRNAIQDGYDYVVCLPIEYCAENSDTLFQHAQEIFHEIGEYNIYDSVDYGDFSVPYTREIRQGKTRIIYNGVPVGTYQTHVIEAFYQSLDSVVSKKAIAH